MARGGEGGGGGGSGGWGWLLLFVIGAVHGWAGHVTWQRRDELRYRLALALPGARGGRFLRSAVTLPPLSAAATAGAEMPTTSSDVCRTSQQPFEGALVPLASADSAPGP